MATRFMGLARAKCLKFNLFKKISWLRYIIYTVYQRLYSDYSFHQRIVGFHYKAILLKNLKSFFKPKIWNFFRIFFDIFFKLHVQRKIICSRNLYKFFGIFLRELSVKQTLFNKELLFLKHGLFFKNSFHKW